MWSYRLYRYPSPSSSTLVYGSRTVSDPSMAKESTSPHSLAQAVYRALSTGTKLPPLNDSEELKKALITFEPSSHQPDGKDPDSINGNKSEGRGEDCSKEKAKTSRERHKEDTAREDSTSRKSPSPSVLMLEALSRRRLDAVRQLHEVCPQLLASIPLFDRKPSVAQGSSSRIVNEQQQFSHHSPQRSSHTSPTSNSGSGSSSIVLSPNVCHLPRFSRLLDLASENQTLLVFVLQHHPEICQQHRHKAARRADRQVKPLSTASQLSKKPYDSAGAAHSTCQLSADIAPRPQPAPSNADSHAQKSEDRAAKTADLGSSKGKEDVEEKKNREGDPLAELDPNNPITICIRKNNPEVLQYLLFKHVWQHFLLDEMFSLPHNSYVPDFHLGDLLHACPNCPWFVHCAALMGCPQLLQLVLCGQFSQSYPSPLSPDVSYTVHTRGVKLLNSDTGEKTATATAAMQSLPKSPDLYVNEVDEKIEDNTGRDDLASIGREAVGKDSQETDAGKIDENLASSAQTVIHTPSTVISLDLSGNVPSSSQTSCASIQNTSSLSADTMESEIASTSQKPRKSQVKKRSEMSSVSSRSWSSSPTFLNTLDPNKMFPVSLPVMDRWISRCMHVKVTPLHLACWRCDPASITVLLNHGADVRLLAEELLSPDMEKEGNVADNTSGQATGTASSDSSIELNLNFVSVTVNSSSLDLTATYNSMEEVLKKANPDKQGGLSALAMLALGVRSPPDFSLSIGKSLGLVLPTLPELWGGQVDRSCRQAKLCLLEALTLLLEAGSDVNTSAIIFGKDYRVMELFLQPSVDLYYAPLMPRGGRDSAVLRCMDLERVAEIVLSACWELCSRGARLGPKFSSTMEWNLFHMDWMFMQNESLQRRFLHLAVFLGLFPPLDPALYVGNGAQRFLGKGSVAGTSSEESQSSVNQSSGGMDLRQSHLPPYSPPPRPSCVPWAPSTSRMSSLFQSFASPAESEEQVSQNVAQHDDGLQQPTEVVTSYHPATVFQPVQSEVYSPVMDTVHGSDITPPVSQTHLDSNPFEFPGRNRSPSSPSIPSHQRRRSQSRQPMAVPGSSPMIKAQMAAWALEEHQRRCLEKFVNDAVRLSIAETSLTLILRFLCVPDLHLLAMIAQHMLQTSTVTTESPVRRIHDALCQAQFRTLQHSCKLTILMAARWHPSAVHCLPLPDSLKRYLLDPY